MSQIRQVKEASDIVSVIGERVSLQKSGSYFKGLCPFHSEKSPSFFVNEQMQRYKCFGCGETGDVFTFLEKYEGMTFYEALSMLADQAGITLKEYTRTDKDELHDKLLQVLDLAKEYYHYLLTEHEVGAPAREYLQTRGINKDSIKLFQLGYAMASWDGLISFLHKKKKYSLELLEQAGLVAEGKGGRRYDRFRGRLIFPLTNHRGQVVGFSGRLLDSQAKEAKYINSPETELYHKSRLLYGYSQLYQFIRKERAVIVVEGEIDVITSSQAHVNNIVAIKGSALTDEHAKLLNRTVDTVLLALDTDAAGVEATKKAIDALQETKLELRVVEVPSGKDPDELIREDPKKWRSAVKESVIAYSFLIEVALREHQAATPEGKRAIMEEMAPVLSKVRHAVELEHYVRVLSEKLNVKEEAIHADIARYKRQQTFGGKTNTSAEREKQKPAKTATATASAPPSAPSSRRANLESYLFYLLFQSQPKTQLDKVEKLLELDLVIPGAKQLLAAMLGQLKRQKALNLEKLNAKLPEDLQQLLFDLHTPENFLNLNGKLKVATEWRQTYHQLATEVTKAKISAIAAELAKLDEKRQKTPAEEERQNELLKQIVQFRQKLKVD